MPSNPLDHPHSQGIILTEGEWEGLSETEEAIETSLLSGDPQVAVAYGRDLVRQGFMKGLKLAKFLFEFREGWADTKGQVKGTDQRVEDFVFFEMGVPVETFTKYTDAYGEVLLRSPEKYRRMIAGKPIGGLILLIAAAREGQLEEGDWKDIAFSHDKASIQEVVRRVRGYQTSAKKGITIHWMEAGNLVAWQNDIGVECGFLPRDAADPVAKAAIESIIDARGIVRR